MATFETEFKLYRNFNQVADDILELASQILPDKQVYVTSLNETQQTILRVKDNGAGSLIHEGWVINRSTTVCNRMNFELAEPLAYEDMSKERCLDDIRHTFEAVNINSYLGVPIILKNGEVFGTLCAVHPEPSTFHESTIGLLKKVSNLFSYYLDLEQLAYRDSLTGLFNRQFLYNSFGNHGLNGGSLLLLDLDGFKRVNDTLGHDIGDSVLKEVAKRLEAFMHSRPGFSVRLGGDEFVLNITEALNVTEFTLELNDLLTTLSSWSDTLKDCVLSASIGMVDYTESDRDLGKLLKQADIALYQAKQQGKNTYSIGQKS